MDRFCPACRLLAVLIATIAIVACDLLVEPTVRLWTDNPEVAMYVEDYNAGDHPYRVELEFLENPPRELSIRTDHPDVVVAHQLSSHTVRPFLQDLDRLLDTVDRQSFYQELLSLGNDGERQFALPVSFNLPLVLFNPLVGLVEETIFAITPQELQDVAAGHNETAGDRFIRMGFSPRWDPRFLTATAFVYGTEFIETAPHQVRWRGAPMNRALEMLRRWVLETNGGAAAENAFQDQYLYDPLLKLLLTGRIGAKYATSAEFFGMAGPRRDELAFAWLWDEEQVPVLGSAVYAGIPTGATNRRGAGHFLEWLFDPAVQDHLLRTAPIKRVTSFGIAGGFSSLIEVNTESIVLRYPELLGALPEAALLSFPNVLPTYWDELADEVVDPWMKKAVARESAATSLSELLDAWLLTRGE
jgi:hypothetical protein